MTSSSRTPGRRSFLAGAAALGGAGLLPRPAAGFVPAHNWDRYDWGTAPPVRDRLNQGLFPQYPPEEVLPGSDVVMATTPSDDVVPGYGKGLVTYLTGDFAAATFEGLDVEATIDAFARIPLGQNRLPRDEAFRDLVGFLAAELDGGPLVEYVDTFMYGFRGEGHTWPCRGHPFPDAATAEATFVRLFEVQLEHWKRTPLVTNTQPDWSRVGNSELVDRTVRSHNWLRTDTIFVENEQIEAISNRPPWVAAVLEVGMSDGSPESLRIDEGVTRTDNVIAHVMDVGANYWSL